MSVHPAIAWVQIDTWLPNGGAKIYAFGWTGGVGETGTCVYRSGGSMLLVWQFCDLFLYLLHVDLRNVFRGFILLATVEELYF